MSIEIHILASDHNFFSTSIKTRNSFLNHVHSLLERAVEFDECYFAPFLNSLLVLTEMNVNEVGEKTLHKQLHKVANFNFLFFSFQDYRSTCEGGKHRQ